jgi:hypothetical protein
MSTKVEPGFAFTMTTDVGYLVGLVTHVSPKVGSLAWIAGPTFQQKPGLEDVRRISDWRWPVYFLAGVAVHRGLAEAIGIVDVPRDLRKFPILRSGDAQLGWIAFTEIDGVEKHLGRTRDKSIPVFQLVNHTALRKMVESNWQSQDDY